MIPLPDPQAPPASAPPPGSFEDLQNIAAQAPQTLGAALQAQQPQPQTAAPTDAFGAIPQLTVRGQQPDQPAGQQQPGQAQTGAWSPENPFASTARDLQTKYQSSAPPPVTGGPMRHLLTNFLTGGGNAMMNHVGLMTPDQQRANLLIQSMQATQLANQWENQQSEIKFRNTQTAGLQQDQNFRSQMQPLQITHENLGNQAEQFGLDQARQNAPTIGNQIPLDESTAQLAGIPSKFVGQNLSQDDWKMVDARLQAKGYQRFDTGRDGPQGGIVLMDRAGNVVKQLTPVSESGRATAIAKMQLKAQYDANNPKVGNMVVGTDPSGNQVSGTAEELRAAGVMNLTKLGQSEADKVNTARQLTSPTGLFGLIDQDLAQFKPGELEGLGPRWSEFMAGTVGSSDPRYVALRTHVNGLLSTALMQAHVGSRGGERLMEHFEDIANAGKMSLPTLKAALGAERQYVEEKAMRIKPLSAPKNAGGDFFSQFGGKQR